VQNAGIRIVHSLASSRRAILARPSTSDTHRLKVILQPRRNGIDSDDPAYYSVAMAMGKRRRRATQTSMWVVTEDLPRTAAHPFYTRLNHILEQHDFDEYVEDCACGVTQRMAGQGYRRGATSGCY
jgi:hypothetical protein